MLFVECVFWGVMLFLAWSLLVFPLLTAVVGRRFRQHDVGGAAPSSVSIVMAAHNEERCIGKKLEHLSGFSEDYDRFEIIVVSDGSTDRTEAIARSFQSEGVRVVASPGWLGKNRALDEGVKLATGEILVFLDASGRLQPGSLENLLAPFSDPRVGCVGGHVSYGSGGRKRGAFRAFKWIDRYMKLGESAMGFVPAVSGAIHALRSEIYEPASPSSTRDVVDPVQTVRAGYRVVYAAEAVLVEAEKNPAPMLFSARARMTARGMSSSAAALRELRAARSLVALGIFASHKLVRWWLWLPMSVVLLSSIVLAPSSIFYTAVASAQLVGYGLGALGLILRDRSPGLLSGPAFLLLQSGAMLAGTFFWALGRDRVVWARSAS